MSVFKTIFNIGLLLLIFSYTASYAQDSHIDFQSDPIWKKVLKQAKKEKKLIFFDGYTTWCGPCKMMEKEVFVRPVEAEFFNANFINVKYDLEKGEGIELKTQYEVRAFPTYLFVNEKGEVVHRIVGAHTNGNDFLTYSQLAITPGESYADLQKQYEAGDRAPQMMFKYLRALRLAGLEAKEKEIANTYLSSLSETQLLDKAYWEILKFFLKDPYSRETKFLIDHQTEYAANVGAEAVADKLHGIFAKQIQTNRFFYPREGVTFDEAKESELFALLRTSDFKRSKELLARAMVIRYNRQNDWEKYAYTVDAMLDFNLLQHHNNALKDFDAHASTIAKVTENKALLKRALRWSEHACTQETRPEEVTFYLKTKATILEKLGNANEAAEAQIASDEADKAAEKAGTKKVIIPAFRMTPMQPAKKKGDGETTQPVQMGGMTPAKKIDKHGGSQMTPAKKIEKKEGNK